MMFIALAAFAVVFTILLVWGNKPPSRIRREFQHNLKGRTWFDPTSEADRMRVSRYRGRK